MNDDEDDKSRTRVSSNNSVKKLEKEINSINKNFQSVNTQLALLKETDSGLSDSDPEEESHFQYSKSNVGRNIFQLVQLGAEFEPRLAHIFRQSY